MNTAQKLRNQLPGYENTQVLISENNYELLIKTSIVGWLDRLMFKTAFWVMDTDDLSPCRFSTDNFDSAYEFYCNMVDKKLNKPTGGHCGVVEWL